ncbi:MAG TPA: iron-sulfur cluster biosynthesis family protein [Ornithinimicrobium sp.]|nr:iron-sulfur cluster biosynthesis family protein [Ornithinimicrobium sp.]
MLTVTENAQAVVKGLTSEQGMPESAGLRLSLAPDQTQLQVALVPQPEPTDQTVPSTQAPVYVAEDTVPALADQTLDAAQTAEGVGFTLQPQEPTA